MTLVVHLTLSASGAYASARTPGPRRAGWAGSGAARPRPP